MSEYNVKLGGQSSYKVRVVTGAELVAQNLSDLNDVSITNFNKKDKFVLMFDAATNKYVLVNPDQVLSAASNTETTQPGLPNDFINTLDVDLDNKIDLDAGSF
jgi:hypothetical protein